MHGHQNILENRHRLEQPYVLKGSRHTEFGYLIRRFFYRMPVVAGMLTRIQLFHLTLWMIFKDKLVVKIYRTVCRLINSRYGVEYGRFSGSVRTYKGNYLALVDLHTKVVYRNNTAELHGQVFKTKDIPNTGLCGTLPAVVFFPSFGLLRLIGGFLPEKSPFTFPGIPFTAF